MEWEWIEYDDWVKAGRDSRTIKMGDGTGRDKAAGVGMDEPKGWTRREGGRDRMGKCRTARQEQGEAGSGKVGRDK